MSRIRTDPGLGSETRLIRLVARLDPMKDHLTFLNAAVEFLESGDAAHPGRHGEVQAQGILRPKARPMGNNLLNIFQ